MSAKKNTAAAPLARFALAPENARHGVEYDADGLAALAGSIVAFGRLLEPLKVYQDGEGLMVWDGGRRLAALQLLAKMETPPALLDTVTYIQTDRADAGLASMATFLRQPLHPAEAFFAYAALFDAGQTPEQIGAACAVSAKEVAQLLRFRVLAPEVIDAFKGGGMDLDACLAFTISTDHDEQRAVLASFGDRIPRAWQVREAFRSATTLGSHPWAVIVGREAYEAEGGRVLEDLFGHEREMWQDAAIIERLFKDKLSAKLAEVEAEGWASVVYTDDRFNFSNGLDQVEPEGEDYTAEEKAGLAAFVMVGHPAAFEVERGYRRRDKRAGTGSDGGASAKPAQADPARWGWGHGGHDMMTGQATRAVRAALIADPAAAYDAAVAHMAWEAVGWGGSAASGLHVSSLCVQPAEREAADGWTARLPCDDRAAFYVAVAALDADDKAALFAFAFALSVNVRESRTDLHHADRWAHMGWMARRARVTPDAFGVPADDFLKGGSRAALLTAVADLAPGEEVRQADAKKGALVTYVGHKATEAGGWAPVLLRDLLADPVAEKPAKAPRKGRGRGKPEAAAPDTANDADAVADAA